jgi:hypothetical protein
MKEIGRSPAKEEHDIVSLVLGMSYEDYISQELDEHIEDSKIHIETNGVDDEQKDLACKTPVEQAIESVRSAPVVVLAKPHNDAPTKWEGKSRRSVYLTSHFRCVPSYYFNANRSQKYDSFVGRIWKRQYYYIATRKYPTSTKLFRTTEGLPTSSHQPPPRPFSGRLSSFKRQPQCVPEQRTVVQKTKDKYPAVSNTEKYIHNPTTSRLTSSST